MASPTYDTVRQVTVPNATGVTGGSFFCYEQALGLPVRASCRAYVPVVVVYLHFRRQENPMTYKTTALASLLNL